jgi:hypothetical protein
LVVGSSTVAPCDDRVASPGDDSVKQWHPARVQQNHGPHRWCAARCNDKHTIAVADERIHALPCHADPHSPINRHGCANDIKQRRRPDARDARGRFVIAPDVEFDQCLS